MNPVELITRKRDGGRHSASEIVALVDGFMQGQIADYQMSAWLMAAYLRGLDEREMVTLTQAMLGSGDVLTLAKVQRPKVDKHSTGGVGDKISICLAPAVAACGVAVPMVSGRGLGHTGGTLDKLEAIPGYDVRLGARDFERVVARVGCSMIGQTERIAPADRRIYALRDVTGTVECVPLIVASILSKKLAAGLDSMVFDVKVGRGAFMKDLDAARVLARGLVRVARRAGKRTVALLTDMSCPIGRAIGNANETREAIEVLQGAGPSDTRELTLALGAEMLMLGGVARSPAAARRQLERVLQDGSALHVFRRMVEAHGGDPAVVDEPGRLPVASHRVDVVASRGGTVTKIDALELGLAAVEMGAGRTRADQEVDHGVGIELAVRPGARVTRGDLLAWLRVNDAGSASRLARRVRNAFELGSRSPKLGSIVLERVAR